MSVTSTTGMVDSENKIDKFDAQLLDYIERREDAAAISMISDDMCMVVDDYGSLLHYAADYGNERIAEHLIELGAEVDLKVNGKTPLILAIAKRNGPVMNVLLEANADLYCTVDEAVGSLEVMLNTMIKVILKVKNESSSIDQLIEKLEGKSFQIYVVLLRDVELMKQIIDHGYDVNFKGHYSLTVLHLAAFMNDLEMVEFLIDNGADIDAINDCDSNALLFALYRKNYNLAELLLRRGANPNVNLVRNHNYTPLCWLVYHSNDNEQMYKWVELFLRQGADPQMLVLDNQTIFESPTSSEKSSKLMDLINAHLAMLSALGTPIKKEIRLAINSNTQYRNYHKMCRRLLKAEICKSVTLLDLLTMSDDKIKIYMRNLEFASKMVRISHKHELAIDYPYYFNDINKRISTITRLMRLRNVAALTIARISNYSIFHIIAEKIADYLDEQSLENLCQLQCLIAE